MCCGRYDSPGTASSGAGDLPCGKPPASTDMTRWSPRTLARLRRSAATSRRRLTPCVRPVDFSEETSITAPVLRPNCPIFAELGFSCQVLSTRIPVLDRPVYGITPKCACQSQDHRPYDQSEQSERFKATETA